MNPSAFARGMSRLFRGVVLVGVLVLPASSAMGAHRRSIRAGGAQDDRAESAIAAG